MGTVADAPRAQADGNGRLTEEELLMALPARSANREARVGLFVLVGIVAFLAALFTMTDVGTFRGRYYVTTTVENAGGMRRGDPVQMRGVNIGRVTGFQMVPAGVDVTLELYDRYPVPADSRALVRSSGLLGGMVVNVVPGSSPEALEDDAVLPGMTDAGGIMGAAESVGARADTALGRVNQLLNPRTIGNVGETVAGVNQSAEQLQALLAELSTLAVQQRAELAALSASLRRSAAGVEDATTGGELQRSVARIDSLTARLDGATASLNRSTGSLETVLGRLERGEGTLGKLSQDEGLYDNLNASATELNALIADIRANPRKYLSVSVF